MTEKTLATLIKSLALLVLLSFGGTLWYYTVGRKPKLLLSVPIADRHASATAHAAGPGEMLLISGGKATLYDLAQGAGKWTITLASKAPPAPAAAPAPKPAAAKFIKVSTPARPAAAEAPDDEERGGLRKLETLATGEKPDLLLPKRVEKRRAKLVEWAAKLNAKRATLKTPLQIEAFNEDAKKYHAELADVRREAALIPSATPASGPAAGRAPLRDADEEDEGRIFSRYDSFFSKPAVIADGSALVLLRARTALLLDRATGKTTKEIPLAGEVRHALRGVGCVFAVSASPDGRREVTRIATTDGAARTIKIEAPEGQAGLRMRQQGQGFEPVVQEQRAELSADGGALLQVDVRLLEKKIVERQTVAPDAPSALEEADKQTKGGVGNDAAIFAQALAQDAAREASGGKERTDASTYEVTLSRPFETGIAPVRAQVRGRADVFSTKTLDLIATPHALLAFDHTNKKMWEAKLANPVAHAVPGREEEKGPPCLEAGARLYFCDRGFLTAFDLATGQPAWRIPCAGIQKMQLDGPGILYVNTSDESDDFAPAGAEPLVLKVDARDGKILWKQPQYGDCIVSGGQLYVTKETRNAEDAVNAVFDSSKAIQCRWKLYKLNKSNGEPQWEWFQTRRPLHLEGGGRKVGILFADELQVIKSIAL